MVWALTSHDNGLYIPATRMSLLLDGTISRLLWNDADLGIVWPLAGEPILSGKDAAGKAFRDSEVFEADFLARRVHGQQ